MGCCGKKKTNIVIPAGQQKIVDEVKRNTNNSAVKSNRSRPGATVKVCPVCGSKSVASVCPVCYYKF